jgi:predicted nucleic acid-binding protein
MAARARPRGVYLDSSAIVKMVVMEPESAALRRFLRRFPVRVSCALARTEVVRAVRHLGSRPTASARAVLQRIDLLRLDDALLDAAGSLDAGVLRSLDAIHVAAALALAARLEAVVTYDARMAGAARRLGLRVAAPA